MLYNNILFLRSYFYRSVKNTTRFFLSKLHSIFGSALEHWPQRPAPISYTQIHEKCWQIGITIWAERYCKIYRDIPHALEYPSKLLQYFLYQSGILLHSKFFTDLGYTLQIRDNPRQITVEIPSAFAFQLRQDKSVVVRKHNTSSRHIASIAICQSRMSHSLRLSVGRFFFVLFPFLFASDNHSGISVSVSGNRIEVGALFDDDSDSSSGSVYIFKRSPQWLSTNGTDLFLQDGGIAIGTDTVPAAYKLAVDGKIIAEEVTVELSANWPDYVFEDGYDLLSLDSVEAHIADHKHLPDIPSSRDIEQTGLSMSEMFVMQMQKIEELTLYTIEMNKKNDVLQERMEVLERR